MSIIALPKGDNVLIDCGASEFGTTNLPFSTLTAFYLIEENKMDVCGDWVHTYPPNIPLNVFSSVRGNTIRNKYT